MCVACAPNKYFNNICFIYLFVGVYRLRLGAYFARIQSFNPYTAIGSTRFACIYVFIRKRTQPRRRVWRRQVVKTILFECRAARRVLLSDTASSFRFPLEVYAAICATVCVCAICVSGSACLNGCA